MRSFLHLQARAITIVLTLSSASAGAESRPELRSLPTELSSAVFIGNSFFYYNNGITSLVRGLLRGLPQAPAWRDTLIGIGGSGFDWHDVDSYFRPNGIATYSFDARNNIIFNVAGRKLFDLAIMMDCSQCPVHPRLSRVFVNYAQRHAETVRRHGAQPVFFMSWAYKDKPAMTQQLAEAYTKAGNDNGALVIPAGLAFARAIAERPAIELYASDLRHPSLAGSYLAAATTCATLFTVSPESSTFAGGLDADTAAFLRRVATDTVRAYFGRP